MVIMKKGVIKNMGVKMMKKNNILLSIFLLSLLSCFSTGEPREPFDDSFYHKKQTHVSDEEYTRDSMYLNHTANEYIRLDFDVYYNWNRWLKKHNREKNDTLKATHSIDKIFYDSTKTKLFAYGVVGMYYKPNPRWPEDIKEFTSVTLSAFRDSLNQPWRVYPDEQILLSGAPTLDTLIEDLNYFYFTQLAKQTESFRENGINKFEKAKINLDDPNYWTEYPFWKKGSKGVDSLYGFQLSCDGIIPDGWKEEELNYRPKIDSVRYPDSLLQKYYDFGK